MKEIMLVDHHTNEFIPGLATRGSVDDREIFFRLGVALVDYPFLWNRDSLIKFTKAINEAVEAHRMGRVVVISENRKREDHICKACGNLVNNGCRLEEAGEKCST